MPDETGPDLNLPSIPEVRIPGSFPAESEDVSAYSKATYLHGFTIPSPLLYHSRSREDLLGVVDNTVHPWSAKIPSDSDFEGFMLGSPLQPFYDDCARQVPSEAMLNKVSETGFPSAHDAAFYKDTRTYLRSPRRRDGSCSLTLGPRIELPSPTQTHVYPGEFALKTPAKLPSSLCTTSGSLPSKLEEISIATLTPGNDHEPRLREYQIYTNAGLVTPPPEPCEQASADLSTETVKTDCEQGRKRKRRSAKKSVRLRVPTHGHTISPKGSNTSFDRGEEVRRPSAGRTDNDPDAKPQPSFQSGDDEIGEIPTLNDDSSPTNPEEIPATSSLSEPSTPARQHEAPPTPHHLSTTSPDKAPPAPARRSLLPLKIPAAIPQPTQHPSPSPTAILTIKSCPTPTCTALLMTTPSTSRPADRGGVMEMAAARFARDLGFGGVHAAGCGFGGGMDEGERGEDGLDFDFDMESENGEGDVDDGDGDGWVGEGQGRDFWV